MSNQLFIGDLIVSTYADRLNNSDSWCVNGGFSKGLGHSRRQNLFAAIVPCDCLQFTAGAEHFLTRFPEGNTSNLVLLDVSAVWRLSGRLRMSLTADNLLDRRSYEYVTYGTLSRSEHCFGIRPRSILASVQRRF